jgi:hypothetical protein
MLLAAPASAWSSEAHEIACEIAWQRFTPEAKQLVHDLRRADRHPWKSFSASCAWADTVRDRHGSHPHTAAYHYVNVPPGAAGIDPQRDCSGRERCVTWAIAHYGRQLADRTLDAPTRAEALKFVAHFIGDVHQPLHVGRGEDRGGNEIPVDFLGDHGSCRSGGERDLHEIWDRHILARAGDRWPQAARRLHRSIRAADAAAWADTGILGWANESFQLCESFVYTFPTRVRRCGNRRFAPIDERYYERALQLSRVRLQQAGVRLAHVIDLAARGALPW